MSLLTLVESLAYSVGLNKPTQVVGAPGREMAEVRQVADETGEELARRVQWGDLTKTATITNSGKVNLPSDFGRLVEGIAVMTGGRPVRPLTRAEWADLPASVGTPRYFLLEDDAITLWPALSGGAEATVTYQSKNWVSNGQARFTADTQSPIMDEAIFLKGMIVRWRRMKGMNYADEEAEYESALAHYAHFDDRGRLG